VVHVIGSATKVFMHEYLDCVARSVFFQLSVLWSRWGVLQRRDRNIRETLSLNPVTTIIKSLKILLLKILRNDRDPTPKLTLQNGLASYCRRGCRMVMMGLSRGPCCNSIVLFDRLEIVKDEKLLRMRQYWFYRMRALSVRVSPYYWGSLLLSRFAVKWTTSFILVAMNSSCWYGVVF
jgi:hypothetical protein